MANKDEMENEWGTVLVNAPARMAAKSHLQFDEVIRADVEGFKLLVCVSSGTNANQDAMLMASDMAAETCLYPLCSYYGGNRYTQEMSTSMYDASSQLALPKYPENATPRCLRQVVVLPYWVPCEEHSEDDRLAYEVKCLQQLHRILVISVMEGMPIRAMLVEYILGGNGGELSPRFLKDLGILLKQFNVKVVVDEILTGGRVGPHMCMTTSMPPEFLECVEYITMGKFMQAAIVLQRIPKRPTQAAEKLRGTSTSHEAGRPLGLWCLVSDRMKKGVIKMRREQVKQRMNLSDEGEDVWGQGLLMFSTKCRWQMMKGLKNRLLPQMDTNIGIKTMSCRKTKWNHSTVTAALRQGGEEWIAAQVCVHWVGKFLFILFTHWSFSSSQKDKMFLSSPELAFLKLSVDYIFLGTCPVDSDDGEFQFLYDDVVHFHGEAEAERLASEISAMRKLPGGGRTKKGAKGFIKQAVLSAIMKDETSGVIKRKRKHHSRTTYNCLNISLFGNFDAEDMNVKFWS